jgi:hypothetical protein
MEDDTVNKTFEYAKQTTSAPTEGQDSGAGSIMATMLSRGFVVTRHAGEGSFRPFGIDLDSADDDTWTTSEPYVPTSD